MYGLDCFIRPTRLCCIIDACASFGELPVPSFYSVQAYNYTRTIYMTQSPVYFHWRVCSSIKHFITYHCLSLDGAALVISMVSPLLRTIYVLAWEQISYTDSLLPIAPRVATSFQPTLSGHEKKYATEVLDCSS